MADRSSCGTTSDRGVPEDGGPVTGSSGSRSGSLSGSLSGSASGSVSGSSVRRVVALRPTVRRPSEPVPAWAGGGSATGAWAPEDGPPSPAAPAVEPLVPFGAALPFEPDPEAAAFLNAPRRPLAFYVAPFGTPPFGNPPSPAARSRVGGAEWGPAYPAGA